ncbi:MAG: hypothetical protein IIW15_00800, partial [Firmicutes bacterium]|nr:hypothetical protein [Bacillota bacterium]
MNRRTPNGFSGGVGGKIDERFLPLIYLPDYDGRLLHRSGHIRWFLWVLNSFSQPEDALMI